MSKVAASTILAFLMQLPIYLWLHPPWYAMFSIGMAAYCLARASMNDA